MKLVTVGPLMVGVFNVDGELYALEDRCSHDDGPLVEHRRSLESFAWSFSNSSKGLGTFDSSTPSTSGGQPERSGRRLT